MAQHGWMTPRVSTDKARRQQKNSAAFSTKENAALLSR
jgi:hypothetical protein